MTKSKSVFTLCGLSLFLAACGSNEPHAGKAVWEANCQVCHSVGLAGAPKFGDAVVWEKRLKRGKDSLYTHALEGWGDMPAKGGNPQLSDEQVKLAVDYMVVSSTE